VERECLLLEVVKNLDSLSRESGEKYVRMDFDILCVCVGDASVDAL
jgi:hypothetical protein